MARYIARASSPGASGAPGGLPAAALAPGRACYRRLACPGCGRRGMAFRPWHRGTGYRALLACRCGSAAEV
jgi:hypothetical protein